jgi:hypothetical protein
MCPPSTNGHATAMQPLHSQLRLSSVHLVLPNSKTQETMERQRTSQVSCALDYGVMI